MERKSLRFEEGEVIRYQSYLNPGTRLGVVIEAPERMDSSNRIVKVRFFDEPERQFTVWAHLCRRVTDEV